MFESRLQVAQVFYALSFLLTVIGVPLVLFGPIVVGIFCIVLAHGCAATGCFFHAEVKGYPGPIGIPIGVVFGMFAGIILIILPDETAPSTFDIDHEMAREGIDNARRRDKGYEVLDDDDD